MAGVRGFKDPNVLYADDADRAARLFDSLISPKLKRRTRPLIPARSSLSRFAVDVAQFPTADFTLWTGSGYKSVRGLLAEGRYLVFEQTVGHSASPGRQSAAPNSLFILSWQTRRTISAFPTIPG